MRNKSGFHSRSVKLQQQRQTMNKETKKPAATVLKVSQRAARKQAEALPSSGGGGRDGLFSKVSAAVTSKQDPPPLNLFPFCTWVG